MEIRTGGIACRLQSIGQEKHEERERERERTPAIYSFIEHFIALSPTNDH